MVSVAPLTKAEFSCLMTSLGAKPSSGIYAVAVSGGPDSMALAIFMAKWARVVFVTFDHGLRKESASEAFKVSKWLKNSGFKHHILKWTAAKPSKDLQAEARRARYRALANFCKEKGIQYLVLGHTQDDQAETFFMRLLRGSGVDGLSAMAPVTHMGRGSRSLILLRPFLKIPKARLIVTLKKLKKSWIEDPSNQNLDFTRIKIRQLLAEINISGFNSETFSKTAYRMGRVRKFLESETQKLITSSVIFYDEGYARINLQPLRGAHEEITLRTLAKVLISVSAEIYPPRIESLEKLCRSLISKKFKGSTLMGCQIIVLKTGVDEVLVVREAAAVKDSFTLKGGERKIFDNRFEVALAPGAKSGTVRILGEAGWRKLVSNHPNLRRQSLPYAVKISLPALFRGNQVIAVPQLGYLARGSSFFVEKALRRPPQWL